MGDKARFGKRLGQDGRNCVLISLFVFVIMLVLCPYSPLLRYVSDADEICYKIMGIGLFKGKIPYRDLFDHKGPLTYFFYGLGFFLFGNHNVGMLLFCWIINIICFVYLYKCCRLYYSESVSLFSIILVFVLNTLTVRNIFTSGSKPDNLVTAPLMISAFLFFSETKKKEEKAFENISLRNMFIIGLMCGVVFMIKLNVCFIYFSFIGCYLLWLLIRKKAVLFFKSTGLFLLGIVTVSLPCFLFFLANHALSDFIDTYFLFNIAYSGNGKKEYNFLLKESVSEPAKLCLVLILLTSLFGIWLLLRKKKMSAQTWVMLVLPVLTFVILDIPTNFWYFYIVFLPFYILPLGAVSTWISVKLKSEKSMQQLGAILCVFLVIFLAFQQYTVKTISFSASEKENTLSAFRETHPNMTCMYYGAVCSTGYIEFFSEIPDFRLFYLPPYPTKETEEEIRDTVSKKVPDTIVYLEKTIEELDAENIVFISDSGYKLCGIFDSDVKGLREFFFVREDLL